MELVQINASNIKCMGCVSAIREGLKTLDGVESVEVELESGQVTVAGNALNTEIITKKLAELGYPAS